MDIPITSKILQGSSMQVEDEINDLKQKYSVMFQGITSVVSADEHEFITISVIVELYPLPKT